MYVSSLVTVKEVGNYGCHARCFMEKVLDARWHDSSSNLPDCPAEVSRATSGNHSLKTIDISIAEPSKPSTEAKHRIWARGQRSRGRAGPGTKLLSHRQENS